MAINAAELKTRFTADTTQAERTLRGFVEKQSSVLEKGFAGIGKTIGLAATAAVAGMVVRSVTEVAKMATANQKVETSFEELAAGVGQSADAMLDALKVASNGAISDYDLMLSANRAMMLGVADTAEEMANLLEIAARRGQAMGLSTSQAFNDIVTGLGRGSALILDNLGIVIDLEETYASYALQLGKTSEQLTDIEKKQAMVNSVMRESARTGGTVIADPFERMDVALSNLKVVMGELFSPAVTAAAEALVVVFDKAKDTIESGQEWVDATFGEPTVIEAQKRAVDDLNSALETYQTALEFAPPGTISLVNQWLEEGRAIETTTGEMQLYYQLLLNVVAAEKQLVQAEQNTIDDAAQAWREYRQGEIAAWNTYAEGVKAAGRKMMEDYGKAASDSLKDSFTGIDQSVQQMLLNVFAETGDIDVFSSFDELANRYKRLFLTLDEVPEWAKEGVIAEAIKADSEAMLDASTGFNTYLNNLDELIKKQSEVSASAETAISRRAQALEAVLFETVGEKAFGYGSQFEEVMSTAFDGAIADGHDFEDALLIAFAAGQNVADSLAGVADFAGVAGAALASAAAQAERLQLALDGGSNRLRNLYLGSVGDVYSPSEAMERESQAVAGLEQLITTLEARNATEKEITYATEAYITAKQSEIGAVRAAQRELEHSYKNVGSAAKSASDNLSELSSMLSKVPGLFDPSEVTQEQLDLANMGIDQNFADDYLRRLRDEVQNGVDWEGVDIKDAAAALGMDPNAAAEQILNAFEAAWRDSSLFANPENLEFLNMEAIQAELDRQLAAAEGEKNLRALFGLGEQDDIDAIAGLGLSIQDGLAGWLVENEFDEAGLAIAKGLGDGVKENSEALGGGITGGIDDYIGSPGGDAALYDLGWLMGGRLADGARDRIESDLLGGVGESVPPLSSGDSLLPPSPGSGATVFGAGVLPALPGRAGDVIIYNQPIVRRPHEAALNAQYVMQEAYRKSRR